MGRCVLWAEKYGCQNILFVCCLFFWRYNPLWLYFHSPVAGFSLLVFEVSWSHTTTPHSRYDFSGRVISSSHRPLPDNTQHSQQTNIHAPGGIQTHNLNRRAAVDLRLGPGGHWSRLYTDITCWKLCAMKQMIFSYKNKSESTQRQVAITTLSRVWFNAVNT